MANNNATAVERIDNLEILCQRLKTNLFGIIGIDGFKGVGKTTLAKALEKRLKVPRINIDRFVSRNPGKKYLDFIDYNELAQEINKHKKNSNNIIVEGVMLLAILERINSRLNVHIYVEPGKFTADNIKRDYEKMTNLSIKKLEAYYDQEKKEFNYLPNLNFNLELELASYHKKFNPIQKADIVFKVEQ